MFNQSPILLVDDNEDDVLLMRRAMRKATIDNPVHVLNDGLEAMEYLSRRGLYADVAQFPFPLVILLDLKMPRMSGFELLAWIRQQPKIRRLWVIVLSHSQEICDVNRAYELGANSYLVKPSQLSTLVEMLEIFKEYWLSICQRPDCHSHDSR